MLPSPWRSSEISQHPTPALPEQDKHQERERAWISTKAQHDVSAQIFACCLYTP